MYKYGQDSRDVKEHSAAYEQPYVVVQRNQRWGSQCLSRYLGENCNRHKQYGINYRGRCKLCSYNSFVVCILDGFNAEGIHFTIITSTCNP